MADPQDRPDKGAGAQSPGRSPAKKAPAKKMPAKKSPVKKVPVKKAVAKKAPAKAPAKKAPAKAPALTAGGNAARDAAAHAKSSVQRAAPVGRPAPGPAEHGGHRVPVSIALAAAGLVALVVSRFRRG